MSAPAGRYDDPGAPGVRWKRYWDGTAWTEHIHDSAPEVAAPDPIQVIDTQVSESREERASATTAEQGEAPSSEASSAGLSSSAAALPPGYAARISGDARKVPTLSAKRYAEQLLADHDALVDRHND